MNVITLIDMVHDWLDEEMESRLYNIKIRKERHLGKGVPIDVRTLDGETGYRLGELCERSNTRCYDLQTVCKASDIDFGRLVSAVKAMDRWDGHGGKFDREIYIYCHIDKQKFLDYISIPDDENHYYTSTGREKRYVG